MSNTNIGYIFLEDKKQYLTLSTQKIFASKLYGENHAYESVVNPNVSVLHKEIGSFSVFKAWLDISPLSVEERAEIQKGFQAFEGQSIALFSFSTPKNKLELDKLKEVEGDRFQEKIEKNCETVKSYLAQIKQLQTVLRKYKLKLDDTVFHYNYFNEYAYQRANYYNYDKKNLERLTAVQKAPYMELRQISIKELVPYAFLTATMLKNIQYAASNAQTLMNTFRSVEEDKAATDALYVIYSSRLNQRTAEVEGGFVNKNHYQGPLSEAEIFYDEKKARRACSARGIAHYQIWKVSMNFSQAVYTEEKFQSTDTLNTILAVQERELIAKTMETQLFLNMQSKMTEYEKILKANNLLPNTFEKPVETRKTNKI